jgi:hypothetical protein
MLLFIDHVAGKMLIIPAMNTIAGGSLRLMEGSRSMPTHPSTPPRMRQK